MNNEKTLKTLIRECGLKQWEVAEELNVSEYTLLRWLRREEKISDNVREKIVAICNEKRTGNDTEK